MAFSDKKRTLDSETNAEKVSRGTTANHLYVFVKSVIQQIETNNEQQLFWKEIQKDKKI